MPFHVSFYRFPDLLYVMQPGNMTFRDTAILIFANSAEEEISRKKSIHESKLFEELTSHTLRTVKKTGLPFYHFSEKEQQGASFGERFANAIQSIYDKGFDNVIAIGNDSPQLKSSHLLEVYRQLQEGKIVLGPSSDGGFYVMGLHRSKFSAELFIRLPWQQFGLFRKILGVLHDLGSSIHLLPWLHDIDSVEDIDQLLEHHKEIPFAIVRILNRLRVGKRRLSLKKVVFRSQSFPAFHYNKGSPFLNL